MRYSFMTFSTPGLTLAEVLAVAARYGYDAIEPRIDSGHRHGIELTTDATARATIRAVVAASGLALSCLATSCCFANPATCAMEVAIAREAIDLAGDVGAPCIRVFGGQLGVGLDRTDAVALLVAALGSLAGQAAARGVTVCLETHDDWCDPRDVAAVLTGVNHPNIAANWDIMHPVRMKYCSMDEAFVILHPWIHHVHLHDGISNPLTFLPIGTGEFDHRTAIRRLLEIGYSGFLSGEWIDWEAYDLHLPRELATLREYEMSEGSGMGI